MKTLYLRNVPDEVSAGLQAMAEAEHMSLNAFAVRELSFVARRAHNRELLEALPRADVSREDILKSIHEGRRA